MLQAGQHAPDFALPDADMQSVHLSKFRGRKHVVLYFYPRDGTPGCTIQATEFSDHEGDFAKRNCVVLGVSPDDCLRHAEFRDANGISIRLLADPERRVCAQYGVLQSVAPQAHAEGGNGSTNANGNGHGNGHHGHGRRGAGVAEMEAPLRQTIARATFVIDKHGVVRHALYGVSPKGHAMQVLELIKALER
jgi:peroxiredoxin Q/BCP